jgi:hypothetical protein
MTLASGFEVVLKDSRAGAWYGEVCKDCRFYPCHDALMALRLTADRRLQFCLLREEISVPLAQILCDGTTRIVLYVDRWYGVTRTRLPQRRLTTPRDTRSNPRRHPRNRNRPAWFPDTADSPSQRQTHPPAAHAI